jgi:hypothetical protein
MKNFTSIFMAVMTGLVITTSACKKESTEPSSNADDEARVVEMTGQKAVTDALYDDVSMEVMQANADNGLVQAITLQQACATVTITPQDPTVWPKTVTIDYGTGGCTGLNGYLRKGKIVYTLNKRLLADGAAVNITFDNYSVNGYKLEGTYTITNNGSTKGLNISIQLANGKVTYPDGKWYRKTTNTTWVQSAGQSTFNYLDDEYSVTGNGTFTDMDGNTLTAASRTALLRKVSCTNTVSGQADLVFNNIAGLLDFGSGSCDKNAVITVAGKNYPIELP